MGNIFNMFMVKEGHKALCKTLREREDWYLAIGDCGNENPWELHEVPPVPDFETKDMLQERGRRRASTIAYVKEDPVGEIGWGSTFWSITTENTMHLYLKFAFSPDEAVDATVRQIGIFLGTKVQDLIPPGQFFLQPQDIKEKGILFWLQNVEPRVFSPFQKETMEYILTF
jgi:hypothetical protein